jgi:hypothetical protein
MVDGDGVVLVVAAAVVFPTLLIAGCAHLLHTGRLARVLVSHGWSATLSRPVAVLVTVAEVGLGAAGTAGVLLGTLGPANPVVAVAATVLLAAYAVDAGRVLRSGVRVPCGCGPADHPVNQWVVIRAIVYACLAATAVLSRPALGTLALTPMITALAAAMVIGLLLWLLPRTLAIPAGHAL